MKKVYLIDLDSTITRGEILPAIAKKIGKEKEMKELTEKGMMEDIPFDESLKRRMKIISDIPVSSMNKTILDIPLNNQLVNFIKENKENCYIVSGTVDVLIDELMTKFDMKDHFYSSHATVKNDKIVSIDKVINKSDVARFFKMDKDNKIIAIGDGSNDAKMAEVADLSIAFGGVRKPAPSLVKVANYIANSEEELCDLLKKI